MLEPQRQAGLRSFEESEVYKGSFKGSIPVVSIAATFFGGLITGFIRICSYLFWVNQFYIKDSKRQPQKGTATETISRLQQERQGFESSSTHPLRMFMPNSAERVVWANRSFWD